MKKENNSWAVIILRNIKNIPSDMTASCKSNEAKKNNT